MRAKTIHQQLAQRLTRLERQLARLARLEARLTRHIEKTQPKCRTRLGEHRGMVRRPGVPR